MKEQPYIALIFDGKHIRVDSNCTIPDDVFSLMVTALADAKRDLEKQTNTNEKPN